MSCIDHRQHGDSSGPVVATLAEAGVMFLLFNLGLHFSPGRERKLPANDLTGEDRALELA